MWAVEATDRTSPGNYESNKGVSEIKALFDDCSLEERYDGTFKTMPYHFKTLLALSGGGTIQKLWIDSEHGSMMLLSGKIDDSGFEVMWSRKMDDRTMVVRHNYSGITKNGFLAESYLSTDSGATWQLTHRWRYTRKQ